MVAGSASAAGTVASGWANAGPIVSGATASPVLEWRSGTIRAGWTRRSANHRPAVVPGDKSLRCRAAAGVTRGIELTETHR